MKLLRMAGSLLFVTCWRCISGCCLAVLPAVLLAYMWIVHAASSSNCDLALILVMLLLSSVW